MKNIVIFGNSGSGKSTLAKYLANKYRLAHLDLDTIAWQSSEPPSRMPILQSQNFIQSFLSENPHWVIEGCYSDLLQFIMPHAEQVFFLKLPTELCVENAKRRPWEPHKYASKSDQDANLNMLIDWIRQYEIRTDTFSLNAHQKLFDEFDGDKSVIVENQPMNEVDEKLEFLQ